MPGVAEVASVGGLVKQYQIDLDPIQLGAYNVALKDVVSAVERSNNLGAMEIEAGDTEEIRVGLHASVIEGALLRLRPKVMTVGTVVAGLPRISSQSVAT
jgi:Cu/Ag efflux pump CusA